VLSRRGLCGGMITRVGESYRLWCVFECEREASMMMTLSPPYRLLRHGRKKHKDEDGEYYWSNEKIHIYSLHVVWLGKVNGCTYI